MWNDIQFAHPLYLWLLLLLIPMVLYGIFLDKRSRPQIQLSTLAGLQTHTTGWKQVLRHAMIVLRAAGVALLILALARPQSTSSWENVSTEGIDIVIALDISSSMLAEDFKPNRLEASKEVAMEFISGRKNDRMGLVVFSGESFTQCPLTTDHAVLLNLFQDIESGMIEDGTAIGLGLANAISRLKESTAKSKVVILLTDGVNNQGEIAPLTAAEMARTFGMRVYTIGVGTLGTAPYPFQTAFGVQYQNIPVRIDEDVLKEIANLTGGQYFRATHAEKLRTIYDEINQLETSKIEVREVSQKTEEFTWLALLALGLLLIEILLRTTIFRSNP